MAPFHCLLLERARKDDLAFRRCDEVVCVVGELALLRFSLALLEHVLCRLALGLLVHDLLVREGVVRGEIDVVECKGIEGEFFLLQVEATQDIGEDVDFTFDVAELRAELFDEEAPSHDTFRVESLANKILVIRMYHDLVAQ